MNEPAKILIVDDDPANADYVARILDSFSPEVSTEPEQALNLFYKNKHDIVISDQKMPVMSGLSLLKHCHEINSDFHGIIISAYTDSEDLIDAVNSNIIYKYIIKPFMPDMLLQHVLRAYESLILKREKAELERKLHTENRRLKMENSLLKKSGEKLGVNRLTGNSNAMIALKEQIKTYSGSDSSILITGETGSGKELVARAIHEHSFRKDKPLVSINCTTLSQSLIESELFGHEKNAFTGASMYKKGFFETADGGSIFLDEAGDIPLELQPKLLRIIQFGTFYPVGGREEKQVDVRIIAASNIDLEKAVAEGKFREDLFHRLNRLRLRVPPLRERTADIPELFRILYIQETGTAPEILPDALELFSSLYFSGNVRELETYVHRLLLVNPQNLPINKTTVEKIIEPEVLKSINPQTDYDADENLKQDVEQLERDKILHHLERNNFNITKTAEILGLSRPGLHNKMKRYGISKKK